MTKIKKVSLSDCIRHFNKEVQDEHIRTPQYRKNRACLSKTPFLSRDKADGTCERIYQRSGEKFHSYKCEWCNLFHIGHDKSTEAKERAEYERLKKKFDKG